VDRINRIVRIERPLAEKRKWEIGGRRSGRIEDEKVR
jgi:hypothetical protein